MSNNSPQLNDSTEWDEQPEQNKTPKPSNNPYDALLVGTNDDQLSILMNHAYEGSNKNGSRLKSEEINKNKNSGDDDQPKMRGNRGNVSSNPQKSGKRDNKSTEQSKLQQTNLSLFIMPKEIKKDQQENDEFNTSWIVPDQQTTEKKDPKVKQTQKPKVIQPQAVQVQQITGRRGNRHLEEQKSYQSRNYQRSDGFKKKKAFDDNDDVSSRGGGSGSYGGGFGRGERGDYDRGGYGRGARGDHDRGGRGRGRGERGSQGRGEYRPRVYDNDRGNYNRQPYQDNYGGRGRGGGRDDGANSGSFRTNRQRTYQGQSGPNTQAPRNYEAPRERQQQNFYSHLASNNQVQTTKKQQVKSVLVQVQKTKKLQILPRGQKCWPEVSMYIMETKLTFSFRQITEHECDILIIPYRDIKLDVYPGNIINKCSADYRKKITDKGDQISEVGFLYPQKCVGIENFKALGFLKLGRPNDNKACFAGILPKLKNLSMPVSSILIPYSKDLGSAKQFLKTIIESLSECLSKPDKFKGFKEIHVSTNNSADFKAGMRIFIQQIEGYMEDNKICIDF